MGSSVILPQPGQPKTGADPEFKSAASPNVVTFAFAGVGPPSSLYIQRDDILAIEAFTNQALEQLFINARILLPQTPQAGQPDKTTNVAELLHPGPGGAIVTIQNNPHFVGTRTIQLFNFPLTEGYLLSVCVNSGLALQRGQTFVRGGILRGGLNANNFFQPLFEDYVASAQFAGWPGGSQRAPSESSGWVHSLNVANPAAAADWTLTAATGQRMRIGSFQATFTASAAVANRNIQLTVDDGANPYYANDLAVAITAGQVITVVGTTTNVPVGVIPTIQPIVVPPGLILPPAHRIRMTTANIQAGDQWSSIWFGVEEWFDQF